MENLALIPGLGRSPGKGNSYPLQYSGLENSMDRGAWKPTVHDIAKSQTQLHDFHILHKIEEHIYMLHFISTTHHRDKAELLFSSFFNYFHIYLGIIENIIVIYYSVHHRDLIYILYENDFCYLVS